MWKLKKPIGILETNSDVSKQVLILYLLVKQSLW